MAIGHHDRTDAPHHVVQSGGHGQIRVGDQNAFRARVGRGLDPGLHGPVEAQTGGPQHLGSHLQRPLVYRRVVAHDGDRQVACRGDHLGGHLAGQSGSCVGVEGRSQSNLGLVEGLDRNDDGGAHDRHATGCPDSSAPTDIDPATYSPVMEIKVTVLGSGSWGTTIAALAARNAPTTLWSRRASLAEQIDNEHENGDYLAGFKLPSQLRATADLERAVSDADVLVMGVPSQGFRDALEAAKPYLRPWVPVVSLTKGLEVDSRLRMTQVIQDVTPGHPAGLLTGPNLAKEILAGHAAASVIAMDDDNIARALQRIFQADLFRVYLNEDIVGCELGGVLKNVIAIASGMADGLGAGDNTRAAVITRGLSEITRLGVRMGGHPLTFSGLAGMGDLVATCISTQSRNRHVGERLGRGETIAEIIEAMNMVAEGVKTSKVVKELADELGVRMPIAEQVYGVCHDDLTASDAYDGLLNRGASREMDGISPAR